MAGLDPAIHVFVSRLRKQDVDHRNKPGDDRTDCFIAILAMASVYASAFSRHETPELINKVPALH
jgi:hypothetical protein